MKKKKSDAFSIGHALRSKLPTTEWQVHIGLPSTEIHIFYTEAEAHEFAKATFDVAMTIQRGVITAPKIAVIRVVRHPPG